MAKIDLKFLAVDNNEVSIQTFCNSTNKSVVITMSFPNSINTICLDKSTAIKFAKTLRTEINKMEDE